MKEVNNIYLGILMFIFVKIILSLCLKAYIIIVHLTGVNIYALPVLQIITSLLIMYLVFFKTQGIMKIKIAIPIVLLIIFIVLSFFLVEAFPNAFFYPDYINPILANISTGTTVLFAIIAFVKYTVNNASAKPRTANSAEKSKKTG